MLLHRLHLQNYKQYAELDLEFREGLVGIIGRNGAGKSTLFDAILYCLYGREDAGKTLVRSSFADPKATVLLELEFFVGENLYRARREFRGKALAPHAELYKDDQLVAKTTRAVNDEVARILHMERDAFKRSVFSGQKELDDLTKATREERRKLVRRMLGLERLDEIQTTINADARDTRNRILGQMQALLTDAEKAQIEAEIAEGENQLSLLHQALAQEKAQFQVLNEQYQQTKARFEEAEQRLKRHNELAQRLEQTRERIQQLTQRQQELAQKIAQLNAQRQQVEAQRPQFEAYLAEKKRLDALEVDRQKYLNQKVRTERLAAARQDLEKARHQVELRSKKIERLPGVNKDLEKQTQHLARIKTAIEAALERHSQIKGEIAALQERLEERKQKLAQIRSLGRLAKCPTCLQPLLLGYDRVLRELNEEITSIQKGQIQTLEKELQKNVEHGKSLRLEQQNAEKALDALKEDQMRLNEDVRQKSLWERECKDLEEHIAAEEAILRAIGEVKFDEAQYDALKARVRAEEPRYLEFTKLENYVQQELPRTLRERQIVQEALAQSQQQLATLTTEQQNIGHDPAEYEAARDALTAFADRLREQSERVQAAEKARMEQQNHLQHLRERLERDVRLQEQIRDQRAEVQLLEQLSSLVGQFKAEILARVGPGISREASELFNRITRGRYENIRVNDDFDFSISDGGIYYPIERFSGGEVDLANLCLRIAITKAIFDLSGASQMAGFLAFDEVLGSQDEERRVEIMLAFHYLKEQFRQIYIVSHIESLKDFFPNILEVSVGPEGSRAVWK
jgi:exonuclease SbcC